MSRKKVLIILSLSIVISGIFTYLFYNLGNFFCMGENVLPEKADLVFIMSSYNKERADTAAEIYKKGIASKILVCKSGISEDLLILGMNLYDGDLQKMELVKQGVLQKDIILKDRLTTSSYEDILCLKEFLNKHPEIRNVIIVTSPYHKRRVYYIARKVLKNKNFWVVSRDYNCSEWYKRKKDVLWVWNELLKLAYYTVRY